LEEGCKGYRTCNIWGFVHMIIDRDHSLQVVCVNSDSIYLATYHCMSAGTTTHETEASVRCSHLLSAYMIDVCSAYLARLISQHVQRHKA